jgi:phytoene dehydrogenase-like protein
MAASSKGDYDAVVVGSGPNGLAAAVELARHGRSVLVVEADDEIGGGARTRELTLPGALHDVCSAVHPLAASSPFFASLPLERHGLEWLHPPVLAAHPLEGESAAVLQREVATTAAELGADGARYRQLVEPLVERWGGIADDVLGPLRRLPRHPADLARFGRLAVRSGSSFAEQFQTPRARALVAGMCAHASVPLDKAFTAGVGLTLMVAGHRAGWPLARGGSGAVTRALASYLGSLGGEVETGRRVEELADIPPARAVLFATSAWEMAAVCGTELPASYRRSIGRFRRGPGVFKLDLVLDAPIPWADPACVGAGTVHLGGTLEEIVESEQAVARSQEPERPFVLLAQPSVVDETRAPEGQHVVWAYCHVPNASRSDATARIEAQIERFAPRFREQVVARHTMSPAELELYNPSYAGGDISAGAMSPRQVLARPAGRVDPYRTPAGHVYLCSSSTPPGPGVHGMCGFHAARSVLRHSLR